MKLNPTVSTKTRNNWLIDTLLFVGAVLALISGIYFLFLPIGGYQGGRNPMYGVQILFSRTTWSDLHTWGGILMILAATVHIIIHWDWIVNMTRRVFRMLVGKANLNLRSRFNVAINAFIGISFTLTALTGIYLLFVPGGNHGIPDPMILFSRTTWDLVHTWAGVVMTVAGLVHLTIHWKWVAKVTSKVLRSTFMAPMDKRKFQRVKVNR
jgi:hypothetical protein